MKTRVTLSAVSFTVIFLIVLFAGIFLSDRRLAGNQNFNNSRQDAGISGSNNSYEMKYLPVCTGTPYHYMNGAFFETFN